METAWLAIARFRHSTVNQFGIESFASVNGYFDP